MEDKAKEVIRGLEAELPQRASFRIIDVLSGILLDHYKIFTPAAEYGRNLRRHPSPA